MTKKRDNTPAPDPGPRPDPGDADPEHNNSGTLDHTPGLIQPLTPQPPIYSFGACCKLDCCGKCVCLSIYNNLIALYVTEVSNYRIPQLDYTQNSLLNVVL